MPAVQPSSSDATPIEDIVIGSRILADFGVSTGSVTSARAIRRIPTAFCYRARSRRRW
jgi:hypothetical protein